MSKENLCWTCSKCMTTKCPKHENPTIEKKMRRTKVYECDNIRQEKCEITAEYPMKNVE